VIAILIAATVAAASPSPRPFPADPAKVCDPCAEWNAPREPFRVYGNTYYVGTGGLSAVLVTSDKGHILLDGGLTQSAPLIDASIRKLGFRTEDVRLIVNSHAHFDHAGGIAALKRASGADVAAGALSVAALTAGEVLPGDPQHAPERREFNRFPPIPGVRGARDGEVLRVADLAITAHFTPGHTPGGAAWTWRSCEEKRCVDVVYADSLTPVSADGFRFGEVGDGGRYLSAFRATIEKIGALPCDILLAPHPGFVSLDDKIARRGEKANPWIDPAACRAYADNARRALAERLQREAAPPSSPAP
jgi:metallo-beta-lactamase class B